MASLAVQGFANVETLGGPRPTSLFAMTIARSGERKSACDAPLMAPLRAYEREQAKAQREDMERWRNAHALWKGTRDKILTEAKSGKGEKRTAAQADLEALGPEPEAPPSIDRTVTEPTFEGLTKLFAHGQIRWLRPDYQNPAGKAAVAKGEQATMDIGPTESTAKAPWPKTLPEQIAAVRGALHDLGTATPEQVARQFQRARAASVQPLLQSLAALGQARLVEGGRFAA